MLIFFLLVAAYGLYAITGSLAVTAACLTFLLMAGILIPS